MTATQAKVDENILFSYTEMLQNDMGKCRETVQFNYLVSVLTIMSLIGSKVRKLINARVHPRSASVFLGQRTNSRIG